MKGGTGKCTTRLSMFGLAIALGVVSAISVVVFAWMASFTGHGAVLLAQWAEFYPGLDATIKGGLIGAVWAFIDGFICGIIVAAVYNLCLCCCKCCCCGTCDTTTKEKKSK